MLNIHMPIQLVNNYVVILRDRLFLDAYSNPFEAYYSSTNDINIHQEMKSVITFSSISWILEPCP